MLVRKENKIACVSYNHKVSKKENEYRWGSLVDQQTKDIINKAVRDVMNIHPLSEDCRYKVSNVEVWSSVSCEE